MTQFGFSPEVIWELNDLIWYLYLILLCGQQQNSQDGGVHITYVELKFIVWVTDYPLIW